MARPTSKETTYPLRAAARLTGLSPELLRAWERRYGAVEPLRTPGGTRRYRAADLDRLRLLKSAVEAGYRIGEVARLDREALAERAAGPPAASDTGLEAVLGAIEQLDAGEVQRRLALQLSALGPVRFARDFVRPLVCEIGDRWASERLGIASEHLASGVLRSLLGSALVPTAASRSGPRMVFATPSGERHELGLQMAALTALGAGANPVYLGAELPAEDLVRAVGEVGASVLALSLVCQSADAAGRAVRTIRGGLPEDVRLWIGGAGAAALGATGGVERIESLEQLEQRVGLLPFEGRAG